MTCLALAVPLETPISQESAGAHSQNGQGLELLCHWGGLGCLKYLKYLAEEDQDGGAGQLDSALAGQLCVCILPGKEWLVRGGWGRVNVGGVKSLLNKESPKIKLGENP